MGIKFPLEKCNHTVLFGIQKKKSDFYVATNSYHKGGISGSFSQEKKWEPGNFTSCHFPRLRRSL